MEHYLSVSGEQLPSRHFRGRVEHSMVPDFVSQYVSAYLSAGTCRRVFLDHTFHATGTAVHVAIQCSPEKRSTFIRLGIDSSRQDVPAAGRDQCVDMLKFGMPHIHL